MTDKDSGVAGRVGFVSGYDDVAGECAAKRDLDESFIAKQAVIENRGAQDVSWWLVEQETLVGRCCENN